MRDSPQVYVLAQDSFEVRPATLLSQNKGKINPNWILLDSQSTVDLFCNANLLSNIRPVGGLLNVYYNAGITITNMVGNLDGYGTVWYHRQGISNIILLYRVTNKFHVQFYSRSENNFVV